MNRTITYSIIIIRTAAGYTATAPAFPGMTATARGSRGAYARIKVLINARLMALLASGHPVPRDPVARSMTLRIDLWYLREMEDLK